MKALHLHRGPVAALLIAGLVTSTVAPAAEAGRGHGRHGRWKNAPPPVVQQVYRGGPERVVLHESSAAPVIAGIIGGLILGTAIAHASTPPDDYAYWDPYCHERFASLDVYRGHFYRHRHPGVIRVIEVSSGDCACTYRYDDGRWRRDDGYGYDRGYRTRRDDGCDDRGGYRPRYDNEDWDD